MVKINYGELAAKLFCWGIFIGLGYLFFEYFFGAIVPFLVAWGVAYLIYPIAHELSAKIKVSRKVCSYFLLLILLTLIMLILFLLGNRLVFELQRLFSYLTENSSEIAQYFKEIFDYLNSATKKLPIINSLQDTDLVQAIVEKIDVLLTSAWDNLFARLGSALPDLAATVVMTLPNFLFVSLITVIASFYFVGDIDTVHSKVKRLVPGGVYSYAVKIKERVAYGIKRYLKSYFLIFLITFGELFLGFVILGLDYSFVLALIIAAIDFLPVLGTAAVLVPWGIVLLMMQNYFLGVGILVLFVVTTIVRQVIEPKILGKSLGVHPILTLLALYLGFKLFGLLGMFLLPFAVLLFFSRGEEKADAK